MKKLIVVMAALLILMSTAAFADSVPFSFSGVASNGQTVSASGTLSYSGGVLTVQITNNINGSTTVGQNVSGFFFNTTGTVNPTPVNSGSGATIDFTTAPATTGFGGANSGGWGLTTPSGGYMLSALVGGSQFPNYTIIGQNASGTGSFATGSHNPFFTSGSGCPASGNNGCYAQFSIAISGITSVSQITNFSLFFGTDSSTLTNQTPEPASMFLFGTGLVGLGGAIRKKIRL
jgi:hypothetical protein